MGSSIQMIGQINTILFWEVTHHSENKAHFWVTDNVPQGPEKPAIWAEEQEQGPVRMLRAHGALGSGPRTQVHKEGSHSDSQSRDQRYMGKR